MCMTTIYAKTERKRQDRSARGAEKHHSQARSRRLRALIHPVPATRSIADAAQNGKCLSSGQVQAIFKSNGTPLGGCRIEQSTAPKQKQRRAVRRLPIPKSPNAPKFPRVAPKQSSQQQPNTQPIQAIKPIAPK